MAGTAYHAEPAGIRVDALSTSADAGVPGAAVRSLDEVADDEQLPHRPIITSTTVGESSHRVISASHAASPGAPRVQRPPPRLGEHTGEVLREIGYSDPEIDALREQNIV